MSAVRTATSNRPRSRPESGDLLEGVLRPGFDRTHVMIAKRGTQCFVLLDPKLIRHCFVKNAENYHQAQARKRLAEPLLGESILTGDGALSRSLRQTIGGLFNRPSLDLYSDCMVERTLQELDGLKPGVHSASDLAARLTLANLSKSLFSGALDARSDDILHALDGVYEAMAGLPLEGEEGGVSYYPRIHRKSRNQAAAAFRSVLGNIITERIGRDPDAAQPDLLDRLIALRQDQTSGSPTLEQMIDDVATFVVAGHETTASVIAWALYLVSQNEQVQRRVREEAIDVVSGGFAPREWPDRLHFTLACVEETERLYPPAPIFTRQANDNDRVADIAIPAGSVVTLPVRLIHRMPRFWTEPDQFRPERFLAGNRSSVDRFAFLPFGLGPRMCIGSAFGNREAIIALAAILSRFDLAYAGSAAPIAELKFVLRNNNGIPLRLIAHS